MRILRSCCVSILFLTAAAFAQFTTVSGTVTDPNGLPYAGGTIVPTLVSSGPPTLNGQAYAPPSQPAGLSTAGSFVMQLGDNTVLLPGGSTWNFHVCSGLGTVSPSFGAGSVCFDVTGVTISGASQSLTTTLSSAAVALTATFAGGGLTGATTNGGLVKTGTTLGLFTTCGVNQIEQFNGTAWVCANAGTGTVTGTGTSFKIPRWNGTSGLADSLMTQTTTSNANAIDIVGNTTQPFFINGTITSGAATTLCSTGTSTPPLPTGVSSACFGSQIISNAQATNATGLSTGLQVQNSSQENTLVGIVGLAQGSGTLNNELRGIEADSETGSAGAITNRAIVAWAAALGTTTTNQGLYAFTLVPNLVTLTNNYGAYIDSPLFNGSNGTVTHNYGLFIADQTTTAGGTGNSNADPHALVTAGTAPSSFGGPLTVSGNLTTNVTGSTQCLHVNSSGVVSGTASDCATSTITKNFEAAGNASNASAPFFFAYNTLPDTGADRGAVWAAALAATVNGVNGFTVDARPEIAANISVTSNALSGTGGGNLLLPPGTINALVGQMMPNGANGLHVIGEGNTGVTAIKACANGLSGCSADMTLNGAGAVTAVIGMGPTTPANGQDVVGSSFERLEVNANGVAGVMGAAMTAGQEMTSFGPQLNIKNSSLVQFDMGEGTNSIQNGGNLNNFYFTSSPVGSAYNPCPTAVIRNVSTISNTTGGVATVTLSGAPTPALTQFGEVLIAGQTNGGTNGVVYNGLHRITSVISSTSFTFNVNSTLADSATGNGTVQAGPIGIRDFTNLEGGGRPIWNGTVVATGCSAGTYPLAQLTASGGPLTVTHVHVEDATYGAAIGVDGNTKDITLDEFSPLTHITNGVLISNLWTTTNVDINDLITAGGGGTTALIDQINSNTLTPVGNGHLGHYWLDQAGYPWTTANPVGGTEVANGFDFYNGTFAIYSGGAANFSANSSGVVSAAGSGTFSGGVSTGAAVPAANTITGLSFIDDVNGNKSIGLTATGSAVDYVAVTNATAANPATVALAASGTDSNVNLNLVSKGTGTVQCNGIACNGFSGLTSGTNTSAAMNVGTGASLVSSGLGQIIGDSNWYNIANGTSVPNIPTISITNSGGTLNGNFWLRLTYAGLATIIPSAELAFNLNATNCSSGTCTVTVNMPTSCQAGNLPAGATGCSVWITNNSVNNEKLQATGGGGAANCVNITTATCVITTIPTSGPTLSATVSSSAGILPSPITTAAQPDFCIPVSYIQIGDGSFFPYSCLDESALNGYTGVAGTAGTGTTAPAIGNLPGTYTISDRVAFNDTATAPILSNSLVSIHHQLGQTTGTMTSGVAGPITYDDRALAVEMVNANSASPFIKQYLGQYNELQVQNNSFQCAPNSGLTPAGEDCGASGRFNVTDTRTANNTVGGAADNSYYGVHGVSFAAPASGSTIEGATYIGVAGGAGPTIANAATGNTQFIGGLFGATAGTGTPTGSGVTVAIKGLGPTVRIPNGNNYGLWLDSNFAAGGTQNYSIRDDGTDPAFFAGKVVPTLGLQNNAQTLPIIGSVVHTGSVGTTALNTPAAPTCNIGGTPGSTTITYKIVSLDNNGYPTAASAQCSVSTANATLSSSNFVQLTFTSAVATNPGVSSFAVYRTSTNGTSPTTTGKIATVNTSASFFSTGQGNYTFQDTGLAPSTASATPPSANAGTSILASGIVQGANTQRVAGSNFTTSSTSLVALFTWHLAANTSYSFHCAGAYQQATAAAGLILGVQAGANTAAAPVNVSATAVIYTNSTGAASTFTTGTLATLATTTATNILAGGAPAATGTNYKFEIDGGLTMNATDPGDFVIMAATANASDQITILKDATYCQLF